MARHVAFIVGGTKQFAERENLTVETAYERKFDNVREIIKACVERKVPIVTFLLLPQEIETYKQYPTVVGALTGFLDGLSKWDYLHSKQIRIGVLGHWYNLPGQLVEAIRRLMDATKDYDAHFVNLCLNYDGRQEIVDAVRLLAMQVRQGKLDPEVIAREHIKESIYTSGIIPPDVLIKTGSNKKLSGFLLWDSADADIIITDKPWQDFSVEDLDAAIQKA